MSDDFGDVWRRPAMRRTAPAGWFEDTRPLAERAMALETEQPLADADLASLLQAIGTADFSELRLSIRADLLARLVGTVLNRSTDP